MKPYEGKVNFKIEKNLLFSIEWQLTRPSWAAFLIASCNRVNESLRDKSTGSSGGSPDSLILLRNIIVIFICDSFWFLIFFFFGLWVTTKKCSVAMPLWIIYLAFKIRGSLKLGTERKPVNTWLTYWSVFLSTYLFNFN